MQNIAIRWWAGMRWWAGIMLLSVLPSQGQFNETWDGGGGDDNWTNGNNWADNTAPGSPQGIINFAGATRLTPNNNFGGYASGYRIFFNSGASSFQLNGNPIKFADWGGNRARIQNDSANTQTVNLRAGANNATGGLDINANAGDIVYDGGSIDGGTLFLDGDAQLRFDGNGGHTVTMNKGIINGGGSTGSVAIRFNTIVIYNAASTYTGGTFLDAGQLRIGSSGSLSGTISLGPTTASAANAATYIAVTAGGKTLSNAITVRSGGSGTLTIGGLNTSGENTFSGGITLQKPATLTASTGGTVKFSGVISQSGTQGVTIGAAGHTGTVLFDNAMTYQGVTTVSFGTLKLNAANRIHDSSSMALAAGATFDLNGVGEEIGYLEGSGNVTLGAGQLRVNHASARQFDGIISGSGSVVKKGVGTWTLGGANTWGGSTFAVGGTLSYGVNQDPSYGGTIFVGETSGSDAATVAIGAAGVTITNAISIRSGSSGTKTLAALNASGTAAFSGPITMNNPFTATANSGGTLALTGDIDNNGNALTITGANTVQLNGIISDTGKLVKQGAGTAQLGGNNLYTGSTEIDLGILSVTGDIADGSTIYIGNGGSGGNATLALAANGVDLGSTIQINTDPGAGTRTITSSAASGATTLSGNVNAFRSLSITATSGSSLTLAGTLKLNNAGDHDASLSGNVTLAGTIDVSTGASDITYSGSGTLTLSGDNSGEPYKLNINGGTVHLASANALGTSYSDKINFATGPSTLRVGTTMAPAGLGLKLASVSPTLQIDPGVTFTISGAVDATAGSPVISKTGTGTLVFTGTAAANDVGVNVDAGVFAGTGIGGALDVNANARISPGTGPGTMAAGNTTWDADGGYTWEINDFNGTPGADPGWDVLNVTGTLTIGASSGNPFTIFVTALTPPGNGAGDAASFDNTQTYTRKIATTTSGISGFDVSAFVIDDSGFSNGLDGGVWSIQQNGNDIELVFTPPFVVPTTSNAVWDGGDTIDAMWLSWTNWVDDARPKNDGTAALIFDGSTRTINTNNYTAGTQFNALFFTNSASSFTLRGNSFAISNKIENMGANPQTIENDLTLNGPAFTEVNPVGGELTLTGAITVNGANLIVYSDDSANGNTVRFDGAVSQGTGSSKLIVRQNATVELAAASTLSGDIEIDRGAIHIADGGSIVGGTAYIGNGALTGVAAAFILTDADGGTTVSRTMNINNGASANRTLGGANTAGINTFSGAINRTGGADKSVHLTAASGGIVDYTGNISGDDAIIVTGGGVTRFSAPDKTSTGNIIVTNNSTLRMNASTLEDTVDITVYSGSTFDLNGSIDEIGWLEGAGDVTLGSGQLRVNHTSARTFAGVISGTGSVVKKGTGTWTLSGANTWSGSIFPVGGTLQFSANPGVGFTGTIQLGETFGTEAATLAIGAGGVTVENPITVRSGSAGTKTIRANNASGLATFSGPVALSDPLTVVATAGGALAFGGDLTQNAHKLTVQNFNTVTLGNVTGSAVIEKASGFGGTLILAGTVNSGHIWHNDGAIRLVAGGDITGGTYYLGSSLHQNHTTLELAADGLDLDRTIEVEDAGGAEVKTIRSTVAGTQTLSGTIRLISKDLILSSTNGSTVVLSGTVDLDATGNNDLYTRGPGDITISGQLNAASGASDLVTQGSGTVTLSGDNSGQSFQIEHGGGTLFVNHANGLGTSYFDKLKINAGSATTRVGVTASPAGLGMLYTGDFTHTLQVDGGATFTVANAISDGAFTGHLIKTGAGGLEVQAANTIDGTLTVAAGTLHVQSGASFNTSTTTVNAGGSLKGNGSLGAVTVSGTIAAGASIGALSLGTTTFAPSGTNSWEITDFTGTAGAQWDVLNISGQLNITATAGQPFRINVMTFGGPAANFDNTQSYARSIATASGGIVGFAAEKFALDADLFANPLDGGTWSIQQSGNDLELVFTPFAGLPATTVIQFK